jgi:hypothetical protein
MGALPLEGLHLVECASFVAGPNRWHGACAASGNVVRIDCAWPWDEAIATAHAASRRSPFPDHRPIQRPGNPGHRPAAGPGTTPGHPRRRLPARSPRTARIRTLVTKDQG